MSTKNVLTYYEFRQNLPKEGLAFLIGVCETALTLVALNHITQ